jgi:GNAT superfamily N-acetyltransferase
MTAAPTLDVVRTYLELAEPAELRPADFPPDAPVRVAERAPCTVAEYRALYDAVGRAYRWRDRLAWPDAQLAEWLARPEVAVHVLERRARDDGPWEPAGYYELARQSDGSVELVYFGLVAAAQGAGLGRALLSHAARSAWAMGASRVWLHTCTLDGPAALPNYQARGFRITGEERYTVPAEG